MVGWVITHSADDIDCSTTQASAYKGLLAAMIWVYPDWLDDPKPSEAAAGDHMTQLAIGHYYRADGEIGNCVCEVGVSSYV